ncbi:hypothetical protein KP509_19G046600 [Ceratopteris richardii]|uniref:Roadblock/LAMTOR2 domain-containing protein n=1 Tax=Ceratopteris richardii TaxID=49495 RepID=A0A8T2SKC6_CERRI|nr:hypothetical protein KP509_19G046600 [Ceratopteris richardii]
MEDLDAEEREAERLLASAKLFQRKTAADETFKWIASHKGVLGTLIISSMGFPIRSTMDSPTTMKFAVFLGPLVAKAKQALHMIHASGDFTFRKVLNTTVIGSKIFIVVCVITSGMFLRHSV